MVLKTQGSGSLKDNIITVFGMSTFNCLQPLSIHVSDNCMIDGFISKPGYGSGRHLGDRQFFFVNGRPVDMPKVGKLVNELYKGANSKQYPIAIMDFTLPATACDVNVTPDKRKLFFSDENSILNSLREALEKIYSPSLAASYSVNKCEDLPSAKGCSKLNPPCESLRLPLKRLSPGHSDPKEEHYSEDASEDDEIIDAKVKEGMKGAFVAEAIEIDDGPETGIFSPSHNRKPTIPFDFAKKTDLHAQRCSKEAEKATLDNTEPPSHVSIAQSSLTKFVTVSKRKHEMISTTLSEAPILRNGLVLCQSRKSNPEINAKFSKSLADFHKSEDSDIAQKSMLEPSKFFREQIVCNETNVPPSEGKYDKGKYVEVCMINYFPSTLAYFVVIFICCR